MEAIPVLMTLSGRAYGGTVEEEEVVDLMTTGLLYPLKEYRSVLLLLLPHRGLPQ